MQLEELIRAKAKENLKTHTKQGYQKSDKAEKYDTNKELAKIAGVSHDTIHKVRVIKNEGTQELQQKVKDGDISIINSQNNIDKHCIVV